MQRKRFKPIYWITCYIRFHRYKHPNELENRHVEAFLNYLAVEQKVSASTQALALNALNFLYKDILKTPFQVSLDFVKSKCPKKLPEVLTTKEVTALLNHDPPATHLPVSIIYGSGLRLMECARLRVGDIDFDYISIRIWNVKGGKHRVVTLVEELLQPLKAQILQVKRVHELDLSNPSFDGVWLPEALQTKYKNAKKDIYWQYLFPSNRLSKDPATGAVRRHHLDESAIQKFVRAAAKNAGIEKRVTPHTLRHSFATHLYKWALIFELFRNSWGH